MGLINSVFRHKKRGGTYTVLGTGNLIFQQPDVLKDMDKVAVLVDSQQRLSFYKIPHGKETSFPPSYIFNIQTEDDITEPSSDKWIMYVGEDKQGWVRKVAEFMDGRFEEVHS